MRRRMFAPTDFLLIGVLALISLACFFLLKGEAGGQVRVTVDGQETATYDLAKEGSYRIDTPYGYNVLLIEAGRARVTESDCPGHDCHLGSLSAPGEIVACLPHHLVLTVMGGEQELDAVTY